MREAVRRAVIWRSGSQIAVQGLTWAATLVVIRLLAPADYGVMALAQIVIGLVTALSGSGIATALVTAPAIGRAQVRAVFGALIVLNVVLAAAQWAGAGAVADFYHAPAVAPILRVMVLGYLFTPFIALPAALRQRALDFRAQAGVDVAGSIVGAGVTLALALWGAGVWALALGQVAALLVRAIGYAVVSRWFVWPSLTFGEARVFIGFGGVLTLNALLFTLFAQTPILIGGRLTSTTEIGLYSTAFYLATLPVARFVPMLGEVGLAAYARLRDDRPALGRSFTLVVRVVCLATFPVYLGLAATAPDLATVVLGPRWLGAAPLLVALGAAMPVYTLFMLFGPPTYAIARPLTQTLVLTAALLVMPAAFAWGAARMGGLGLALAWLAFALPLAFAAWCTLPLLGASAGDYARAALPPLIAAVLMAAGVAGFVRATPMLAASVRLGLSIVLGAALYAGFARSLARRAWDDLIGLMRR